MSAAVLARIEAALDSSRSLDEASFLGAEADIVESYALLLEKRAFFDNPGGEKASVLRRCASDTRFASGDILVDALLKFGLRMGDPENAVREAYLTGWDADVSGLPLAVAWLERVKQGQTTAAAWRDSGCALVNLVDCMLAAVRVSIDVLHGSDEELYTAYEEGLLHARAQSRGRAPTPRRATTAPLRSRHLVGGVFGERNRRAYCKSATMAEWHEVAERRHRVPLLRHRVSNKQP